MVYDQRPDRYWLCWASDEGGRPYHPWVYWERSYPGNIRRWQYIGHLHLAWGEQVPESLELCDIVIFDQYREHNAGTAVIQALIALAEEEGMRGIFGTIHATEEIDPERLAAWYQRNGFTRTGQRGNELLLRLPRS